LKTCLIYGHDGLDLDVTYNLQSFYRRLGFKVFFSKNLYNADLLVVIRAFDRESNISNHNFKLIHIYDYAGWDYDAFVYTIDHSRTYIFCTSEARKERLTAKLNFPGDRIFIALPPVDIEIWSKKLKHPDYRLVHIGNFKPIIDLDKTRDLFYQAINHFNVQVWGTEWKGLKKELCHGKAGLFEVSSIYSKSEYAFGLMYPFQREVTFSGRFWHAPLNGCCLFSEPGLFTQKIPGIIETDYSFADIGIKIEERIDRKKVQKKAIEFWEYQKMITLEYVRSTLVGIFEKHKFNASIFLNFFCIRIINILIKCYQKSGMSGLIIRK
jgi:hypothetical protein